MKKMNPDIMLLIVAIIWGTGFIATEYAIDANMSPIMIMASRFSVAAIALLALMAKEIKKISKDEWIKGSMAGIFLFLGFLFQTIGQSKTSVSNSAFLTATNVVFVPFIVWIITKSKPKNKVFFLAFLTFIGIAVLTLSSSETSRFNMGDLLVLICAIMFAAHIAYLGHVTKRTDPKRMTLIQMLVATVLSIIGLMITGTGDLNQIHVSEGLPSVLFLGLFSTCLCFFMQTSAQKRTSASKTGIILSMESFFGTLFSIVLGIDPLTGQVVIGGIIILTAVILTEVNIDFKSLALKKAD